MKPGYSKIRITKDIKKFGKLINKDTIVEGPDSELFRKYDTWEYEILENGHDQYNKKNGIVEKKQDTTLIQIFSKQLPSYVDCFNSNFKPKTDEERFENKKEEIVATSIEVEKPKRGRKPKCQ
jgi:hypothetical protein